MATKKLAKLIAQEVKQPIQTAETSSEIALTQNTPLADLQLTSQGLFDESKALWEEFVEFDKEHQLAQRVGAQLWRLTRVVGKPALVLSLKGIQTAVVTLVDAEKRTALAKRFSRSKPAQAAEASLASVED